ncbi:MAG: hypothetical protein U0527_09505 [Candidatus Eisenbacteria bacterium]
MRETSFEQRPRRGHLGAAVALAFLLAVPSTRAFGRTLVVDPAHGPYFTIASAVEEAVGGDTIAIAPGRYDESVRTAKATHFRAQVPDDRPVWESGPDNLSLYATADCSVRGIVFRRDGQPWAGFAIQAFGRFVTIAQCDFLQSGSGQSSGGTAAFFANPTLQLTIDRCLFESASAGHTAPRSLELSAGANSEVRISRSTFLSHAEEPAREFRLNVRGRVALDHVLISSPGYSASDLVDGVYHSVTRRECWIWPYGDRVWLDPDAGWADPMLCDGATARVHAESPVILPVGEPIGSLPVGCSGVVIRHVEAGALRPRVDQRVQIYGYGIDEQSSFQLRGAVGELANGVVLARRGRLFDLSFDLRDFGDGVATLLAQSSAGDLDSVTAAVQVVGNQVLTLIGNRMGAPGAYSGTIAGHDLDAALNFRLREHATGRDHPLLVESTGSRDSLRASVDLSLAALGLYDLVYTDHGGHERELPACLYLGQPPVLRVPADFASIQDAIEHAEPGSDVIVAAGSYRESIVIDRPLHLLGAGTLWGTMVEPDSVGNRLIHVLPAAGAITEIRGVRLSRGRATGPGAGILSEAPALIEGNFLFFNEAGGCGGGICAAPGSRIVGNQIEENAADVAALAAAPGPRARTAFDGSDGGGGIYCLDGLIAGNSIGSNSAHRGGGGVVEGKIVSNRFADNFADEDAQGVLRGDLIQNEFYAFCSSSCRIDGDGEVAYNVWAFYAGDLCSSAVLRLTGPVNFHHNTLVDYPLLGCLAYPSSDPPKRALRMRSNILGADLRLGRDGADWSYDCPSRPTGDFVPFPAESLDISCNAGWVWVNGELWPSQSNALPYICSQPWCNFGPDDFGCGGSWDLRLQPDSSRDFVCGELVGARGIGCVVPITLAERRASREPTGIRVEWRALGDAGFDGYWIEREVDGEVTRLNERLVTPCTECSYLDAVPPAGPRLRYFVIPVEGGQASGRELIGEVEWGGAALSLEAPRPHPVRARSVLRFSTRVPGRATLDVIDVAGRRAARLLDAAFAAGAHEFAWDPRRADGRRMPAGVYYLRLSSGGQSVDRRVLLLP